MNLNSLGKLLIEGRGNRGVREFARDIGISHATLSRIENGKLPDLDTFAKICAYLKLDPAEMLQVDLSAQRAAQRAEPPVAAVHFKSDRTLEPEAASDLGALILAAERELRRMV